MTDQLWLTVATVGVAWAVMVVTPGPNFIATAHVAASRSRRDGALVAAGIGVGTTLWAVGSLLGLGLLFQTAGWLYGAVKLIGAAYLVYVGLRMIWVARCAVPAERAAGVRAVPRRAFRLGFLTDISNPKAAAFFTSLFAVAMPPGAPGWFQAGVVAMVVLMAAGWYLAVALALGHPRVAARYARVQRAILAVAGAAFVGFGLKLASDR